MSSNSEKMSKVIDLLTESLVELRAISSSDGEFTSEQVLKIVKHAYIKGQKDLARAISGEIFEADVDTYAGNLGICGTLEVCMPDRHWFEDDYVDVDLVDSDLQKIIDEASL